MEPEHQMLPGLSLMDHILWSVTSLSRVGYYVRDGKMDVGTTPYGTPDERTLDSSGGSGTPRHY